jgi:serine/threonine protein kinase
MHPPQTLGKYRILGQLGRGGGGVVFRSEDPVTRRALAIKTTLSTRSAERTALEREIAALARLTHRRRRGVVPLLDAGVEAGVPWYAMPFVVGENLREYQRGLWPTLPVRVGEATLPTAVLSAAAGTEPDLAPRIALGAPAGRAGAGKLAEVLELGLALAECLHGIHDDGVVHGDLTPQNVIRTPNGQLTLVDFGTAFQLHQGDFLREVPQVSERHVGTPGFMAPEQIRGEGPEPRSDLYALGCMLYELVTGQAPFRSDSPAALLRQHLALAPQPPREVVAELDAELDALLLDLLEKRPQRRVSRAEDVVRRLASLLGRSSSVASSSNLPLYRPELVGRTTILTELTELLPRGRGVGSTVALGAASGYGKTRVLNELGARARAVGCDVVVMSWANAAVATDEVSSGLVAFGTVLSQLALRARAAEPENAALGEALAILAPYAPDALGALSLPPRRNAPSRSDVLASLEQLLRACCRAAPTLLLLDDLQWADELSLQFVRERLPALTDTELLVVCSYRSEEIGAKLDAVRAASRRTFELDPLELPHVYGMARDMLATDTAPEGLPEFLLEHSGGNPFLIAEYLRAAVARGLVARDDAGRFRFVAPENVEPAVPDSLQGLFSLRIARLGAGARAVLELAAALGREFPAARLSALTRDLIGAEALEELVSEQILDYAGDGRYRFVNDKLREAQEAALPKERRRELHRMAAEALEREEGADDGPERQAELGMHWQEAGDAGKSLLYLSGAAGACQRLYAHARAASLYRMALTQCQKLALDGDARASAAGELHERLGDALLAQASHADARAAFEQALVATSTDDVLVRARNLRKIASSHWRLHAHADARRQLELAEQALPQPVAGDAPEVFREYIEIQLGKFEHLYFAQDKSGATERLLAALEDPIASYGEPAQRVRYSLCAASDAMAKARFAFSEQALRHARFGEGVASEHLTLHEEALARFIVGFALMLGERDARHESLGYFERAERGAVRAGDRTLSSRIATYRALTLLRLDDVVGARAASQRALELAETAKISIYVAAAHACIAWVHWRTAENDSSLVKIHAEEAQRLWRDKPASFPFRWCLTFVLLDLAQRAEDAPAQASAVQMLLDPLQQKLPDELEAVLCRALEACNERRFADATRAVDEALRLGRHFGFC